MTANHIFRLLAACLLLAGEASAQVRVASIFGDRMVLQRYAELPVWGTARAYASITVAFAGQRLSTTADESGNWMVRIAPMPAGGPHEMVVSGGDTIRLHEVLVGEVWLCSGQSNMELPVERTANAEQEIAGARYPLIRLFTVKRAVAEVPQEFCAGAWSVCDSASVRRFSGTAYYFGRKLFQDLGVPIGLVHSAYGGTPAEAWMSKGALESDSAFRPILDRWETNVREYPQKKKEFDEQRELLMQRWRNDSATAVSSAKAPPPRPQEPIGPGNRSMPSGLFNAMIAPLVPYAFKGVIWYQGESNASRAYQYRRLFPALIRDWRSQWSQEMPFYYVQLPNLDRQREGTKSAWAELREAQLMTLSLSRTAMAVTIDIGDPKDLHPANKQAVGFRLALLAEGALYGRDTTTFQGPLFRSYRIEGGEVHIAFDHAPSLHARGGEDLKGFVIAGPDSAFVVAKARIEKSEVVVWSESVHRPLSVRYAWADNPACNLVNSADLPASPFRTDDWPELTFEKK